VEKAAQTAFIRKTRAYKVDEIDGSLEELYIPFTKLYCFFQDTSSDRKKVHLGFFALRVLQFYEMALVFHYYLGKFGLNIFWDLKSKQIKY